MGSGEPPIIRLLKGFESQQLVGALWTWTLRWGDPNADQAAKAEAVKFAIQFVADPHKPVHCADDCDDGGNRRHVIFDGHPDNLRWVWDTGLLQHIARTRRGSRRGRSAASRGGNVRGGLRAASRIGRCRLTGPPGRLPTAT